MSSRRTFGVLAVSRRNARTTSAKPLNSAKRPTNAKDGLARLNPKRFAHCFARAKTRRSEPFCVAANAKTGKAINHRLRRGIAQAALVIVGQNPNRIESSRRPSFCPAKHRRFPATQRKE